MSEWLHIYPKLLAIAFRSRMQYRSDFLVGILSVVVLNVVNLAMIGILLARFHSLGGWTIWELVMLYCTYLLSHCIYSLAFWHYSTLEDDLISGRFDQYLIRPISPFLQFTGKELNYMGVADGIFAAVLFGVAYQNLGLHWATGQWLLLGIMIVSGTIIEVSICLLIATLAFWTGRSFQLFRLTLRFNILTQQYPVAIFGRYYQIFVTSFLPIAFVNYYPLSLLLGKENGLGLPLLGYLSPLVAAILVIAARILWHYGIRAYSSSGS